MREILFRGKRADNGEWVYGWFHEIHGSVSDDYCIETRFGQNFPVLPESIGQWTGLYDQNRKRIFEGDTVRDGDNEAKVVWWEKAARFLLEDIHDGFRTSLRKIDCKFMEVIT